MQDYEFMPMMGRPCSYCKMSQKVMPAQYTMPQYDQMDELEEMYPRIFHIINPHVRHHCHMMEKMHGGMHHYLKEEIDDMCERIYKACEKEMEEYMQEDDHDEHEHEHEHSHDHNHDHRQFGVRRNRFGTDLIRILLLSELLRRRRRHPHGRPRPYGYYNHYPSHDMYGY
jgi:hypothetical protein